MVVTVRITLKTLPILVFLRILCSIFSFILPVGCFDTVISTIPVWFASSKIPILVLLKGLFPVLSYFGMFALAIQFYFKPYPSRDTFFFLII